VKSKKPPDRYAAAKRAALNALRRAGRAAERGGVKLSEWEGEFLGSVTERVKTYGRAFADPEKGAPGQPLSVMQTVKLKEIVKKAKGETRGGETRGGDASKPAKEAPKRKGFKPRAPKGRPGSGPKSGPKSGFGGRG
jgi:hypothetical protein